MLSPNICSWHTEYQSEQSESVFQLQSPSHSDSSQPPALSYSPLSLSLSLSFLSSREPPRQCLQYSRPLPANINF